MENQPQPSNLFFKRERSSGEFKLLALIEDTILGILEVIERTLRTILMIAFRPGRLKEYIALPYQESVLIGPFTFLAIASFLSSISLSFDILELADSTNNLIGQLKEISVLSMVKLAFPLLLTLVLFALIIASVITWRNKPQRYRLFKLLCYWFGMVFLLFGIIALSLFVTALNGEPGLNFYLTAILVPGLFAVYLSIRLGMLTFSGIRFSGLRFLNGTLKVFLSLIIAVGVFSATMFIGTEKDSVLSWSILSADDEARLTVWSAKLDITNPNEANLVLMVKNDAPESILIKNTTLDNILLINMLSCDEEEKCKTQNSIYASFQFQEWEDGDGAVLKLDPGESKWIRLEVDLSENRNWFESSTYSKAKTRYIELDVVYARPHKASFIDGDNDIDTYETSERFYMNSVVWE